MTPPTNGPTRHRTGRAERWLLRGSVLLTAALLISALGAWSQRTRPIPAAPAPSVAPLAVLGDQLMAARGEVATVRKQLARAQAVINFSTRYRIPGDVSAAIYDAAVGAGVDPGIAFRLVKVESNFKRTARSSAGALGLTQIRLATARFYDRDVTEAALMDRDVNLRLGFRYLKDLTVQFDHDTHLALLAYNRGPARVEQILAEGGNPRNGYSSTVLKGYRPTAPTRGAAN